MFLKDSKRGSHYTSTAEYSTPVFHYPPASLNYISYDTNERAKGYEAWVAAREQEDTMIARNTIFSGGDRYGNKMYSAEAGNGYLNMRQAVRQKEDNMFALNSALSDDEYSHNTYSYGAGREHMDMKIKRAARQKERVYASSQFIDDDDDEYSHQIYSAEPDNGYRVIRPAARQKEDTYPSSPVLDDYEYHKNIYPAEADGGYMIIRQAAREKKMYSAEPGRGYMVERQAARQKDSGMFGMNQALSDDKYNHKVCFKPSVMELTNRRKAVACGPWGSNCGDLFDDGVYTGIREIQLTRSGGIVSIRVCYDMEGKAVWGSKNGGNHGLKVDKIVLDYPSEYLTHISGYYGSTILRGPTVLKSLTFHTNKRDYGPFGDKQGISFSSAGSNEGKIVGFSGRIKSWYVTSIGVHVMEGKTPRPEFVRMEW